MKKKKMKIPWNGGKRRFLSKIRDFRQDALTIPNLLTSVRIAAVPLVLWLLYHDTLRMRLWAVGVYILAGITDFFDGWVARRYNTISVTGKLLDPLADKFIVLLTLVVLVYKHEVPLLPVLIILAREFYIFGIRALAVENGLVISAGTGGKWKTTFQMFALPLLIVGHRLLPDWDLPFWGTLLLWGSVFFSLQSAWVYTAALKRRLFESTHHDEP